MLIIEYRYLVLFGSGSVACDIAAAKVIGAVDSIAATGFTAMCTSGLR